MKYISLILLLFSGYLAKAQVTPTAPMVNNIPWYEYSKKLSVGKFMLKVAGEYDTSFTVPNVSATVVLDTITEDKTVTFPTTTTVDNGVLLTVYNANSSAFTWNVSGPVKEGNTGAVIATLERGLHMFIFNGTYWVRLSSGGGGTGGGANEIVFDSPLYLVSGGSNPDTARLDVDALPEDTVGVVEHNDSLFNILYSHTGVRDSSFIVLLTGGGGTTIYTGDGTIAEDRQVDIDDGFTLNFNHAGNGTVNFTNTNKQGLEATSTNDYGIGTSSTDSLGLYALSINGRAADFTVYPASTNTVVDAVKFIRKSSGTPANGMGTGFGFYGWTTGGSSPADGDLINGISSQWTDIARATRTSKFTISGYASGVGTDWFTLIPSYGLLGTDTIATQAYARSVVGANLIIQNVGTGQQTWYTSGDTLYNKKLKTTYALTASTASDSSLQYGIDTTLISTRAYAASLGGGGASSIVQGGNSFGADMTIGTNDVDAGAGGVDRKLILETGNTEMARIYRNASGVKFYLFDNTIEPTADGAGVVNMMSVSGAAAFGGRLFTSAYVGIGTTGTTGSRWSQTDDNSRTGMYTTSNGTIFRAARAQAATPYSFSGTTANTKVFAASAGAKLYSFPLTFSGSSISTSSVGMHIVIDPVIDMSAATHGMDTIKLAVINPTITNLTGGSTTNKTATIVGLEIKTGSADIRSLRLRGVGDKIEIATGTNASVGTATLVAGTVTVNTTAVTASSKIFLTCGVVGGTQGILSVGTITAGTSFVINSSNAADTGQINYWIIN